MTSRKVLSISLKVDLVSLLRVKEDVKKNVINDLYSSSCPGLFVTGSTGIAAVNIGGCTIHSFAAVGTGTKSAHELVASIKTDPAALERWTSCQILVIDEVFIA